MLESARLHAGCQANGDLALAQQQAQITLQTAQATAVVTLTTAQNNAKAMTLQYQTQADIAANITRSNNLTIDGCARTLSLTGAALPDQAAKHLHADFRLQSCRGALLLGLYKSLPGAASSVQITSLCVQVHCIPREPSAGVLIWPGRGYRHSSGRCCCLMAYNCLPMYRARRCICCITVYSRLAALNLSCPLGI
jgi:hypothetical protein